MKSTAVKRLPKPRAKRGYSQDVRARQTQANGKSILDAAVKRLRTARRLAAITLDEIAAEAGVTVRTILRQFGSKEGIMEAAFLEVGRQIKLARRDTPAGDIDAALAALLDQYEVEGDLNARVVSEEHEIPILHKLLEFARKSHREWLTVMFGPSLAHLPGAEREQRITALYAATEVQLWKVLRRDLHQSAQQTADIFRRLVRGVLAV
ncbi:MAG TPA: helix-turn-helix domain-containing protein [Humisphaera sp.]|jgi:AcrR family transcriptional regulator|nr:helix-turn-helix domain-containing protein [Humisphaera sp.]